MVATALTLHKLFGAYGTPVVDDVDVDIDHNNVQNGLRAVNHFKKLVDSIRIRYFIVICGSGEHPCSQGLSLGNYMYTKSWSSRA